MACYLVTGAAGFIGSALADKLIKMGNRVVTIDNLSTGKVENIPQKCEFIEGDTSDSRIIDKLYHGKYNFDAIFHIAGQSSGEVSFENPAYYLSTNTMSTLFLLDFAKKCNIKKFIYASSMSIYGEHKEELVNEESEKIPKSFYAVGKYASENYMRIYSAFGIQCTALRFFNVYGIGQNLDNLKQGMASIYLAMALNDNHIVVKGSKDRFRDFVYIDDVIEACLKTLLLNKSELFNYYNISNKRKIKVEYIIELIQKQLPKTTVEYVEGTPGDQFGIYGENMKAIKELNWEPVVNFESGMKKFIDYAIKLKRGN